MQPVGFGSSIILLESVAKKRPPEMGAGVAGLRALGIAVPCLMWAAYNGVLNPASIQPVLDSPFATSGILYLALFTTAGMWYLQTYVTPKVSASDFSLILATEPIFATIIAIAWLGETVGSQELFGGLLVVIACIAADVSLVPKPRSRSSSSSSKGLPKGQ
jgi:drug/metabolite transporter (DMT)-like permease